MSIMVATGEGARHGVLLRSAEALETLAKVDTLVVDKTGTLTEGKPRLLAVRAVGGSSEAEVLATAAALERSSEHPLAAAVLSGARERGADRGTNATGFEALSGSGVRGQVGAHRAALGNLELMRRESADTAALETLAAPLLAEGQTVVFLAIDGKAAGCLGIADPIKPTTPEALRLLRDEGVEIVMLTGDHPRTAESVAHRLGISRFRAQVLPAGKGDEVRALQSQGRVVAMAGDGINDAPALALAQVGIAMGSGTDVAMQSAGVTLVKGDLRAIARARKLSRAALRNIRQNLFFALIYNFLGVPLAAGVLYPVFGILLNPMVASVAMSLSSVSVITNALRLKNAKL
jgi:Cu+-exporting ATPase